MTEGCHNPSSMLMTHNYSVPVNVTVIMLFVWMLLIHAFIHRVKKLQLC
jgi:hypothetical protein